MVFYVNRTFEVSSNIIFDNLLTLLIFLWMAIKAATISSQAGEFLMCTAFGDNDFGIYSNKYKGREMIFIDESLFH